MTTMASEITSLTVVYSTVYSDVDQRKHQSSASLAFVRGIHRDRWIPRTKGQLRGKCFHLMMPSWWRYRSGSTLVMACGLMASSHYQKQYWILISDVLWDSPESNFTVSAQASILHNELENYNFGITVTFPWDQWVKTLADVALPDNRFDVLRLSKTWRKNVWNWYVHYLFITILSLPRIFGKEEGTRFLLIHIRRVLRNCV